MIHPHFLRWLSGSIVAVTLLVLGLVWTIDPYGVSPIRFEWPGINAVKPKRVDIDRLIKPYEVWSRQPRTVFLGTSRIHQSIDPSVLDGTQFAPAYNASIPASTLSENAAHLEQFLWFNPHIEHVFVEIFLYNLLQPQPPVPSKSLVNSAQGAAALLFSTGALFASAQTIAANQSEDPSAPYVAPAGYRILPAVQRTEHTFSPHLYTDVILRAHKDIPGLLIQPSAIAALDRIVELCRVHGATLHLLVTPNYPWDDYRLLSLGYWGVVEKSLRKLSAYDNVTSFSQYNEMLIEPPGPEMRWWYDPIHFSREMGRAMLLALIGKPEPDTPANLVRRVTPATVETVIQERRAGLDRWVPENSEFTNRFEMAKDLMARDRRTTGLLDIQNRMLIVDGRPYSIVPGFAAVEAVAWNGARPTISGWVADVAAARAAEAVVASVGERIVAKWFPTGPRFDIEQGLGRQIRPAHFVLPIADEIDPLQGPIRIFALLANGTAVQATSTIPPVTGVPFAAP